MASRTWKTRQRLLVVAFVAASVMAMAWLGIHGMSGSETPQQSFSGKIAFVAPWDDAGDDAIQNDFSEAVSPITPEIEIASNAELALDDPAEGMPPKSLFEAELSVAEATQTNTVTNAAPVQLSPQPTDSPLAEPAMTLPPTADPNLNLSIGMLLVVEVKCLDGVDRNALMREATQWARIDANAEYEISDDMVGVAEEVVSSEAPFQMIFLNAPARSLDRLHLRLASDKDRVESIGLTVANDVQLVGLSDSINQDPSLIRDTAVAVQITGESGMDGLADLVDSLTFLPVTNGDLSLGGQSMTASGPDELAQILFIVR